ncbi:MAG: hypothetical protein AAF823_11975 [Planctomycetota bacterium]
MIRVLVLTLFAAASFANATAWSYVRKEVQFDESLQSVQTTSYVAYQISLAVALVAAALVGGAIHDLRKKKTQAKLEDNADS